MSYIKLRTRKMLWALSGNICSFPDCKRELISVDEKTHIISIVGDEAHIVGEKIDSARGNSDLPLEQRDDFDNLILLCKPHHKIIDDHENIYTVENLKEMKKHHLEWVKHNLKQDATKLKDDDIYASYVDDWIELAQLNQWKDWSFGILSHGQPRITITQYDNLRKLNEYLLSRMWPKRYQDLEKAFINFSVILNDFLLVFDEYKIEFGDKKSYITEKFYNIDHWDKELYDTLAKKYDFYVDLVQDLMLELTRAANFICDHIRKQLDPTFRIKEGVILVVSGPTSNLSFDFFKVEYREKEIINQLYPGLKEFMTSRNSRDMHFGKGYSSDYFTHIN